eukprot:1158263-Pelagomonas_calceolata.AAC.10
MEARPAPKGPLLIPLRRILLAILWHSVTIMASGHYEAHCMLLVEKKTCAVSWGALICLHGSGHYPQRQKPGAFQLGDSPLMHAAFGLRRLSFSFPGGVMDRIAFKVDTCEGCVCSGVVILNSLVFGKDICTFVTRNASVRFYLVEVWGKCGKWQGLLALDDVFRGVLLVEGSLSNFLKPVSMSGCLALRIGSLLMVAFHQRASRIGRNMKVAVASVCSIAEQISWEHKVPQLQYREYFEETPIGNVNRRAAHQQGARKGKEDSPLPTKSFFLHCYSSRPSEIAVGA